MNNKAHMASLALAVLALGACSQDPENPGEPATGDTGESTTVEATEPVGANPEGDATTLRLEGLGDLTIGKPIPAGSTWAVRGAQISESCQTASSPDFPGAYAIVTGEGVRRITISNDSDITLIEGIGPGSTEAEVLAAFPGFVASPHKYVEAPAKYLTQPGNDPRLLFELDADGKVGLVHVGMMPELGFVEGCA